MLATQQPILADWQRFIRSGFREEDFTPALHRHLTTHCALHAPYGDRRAFWGYWFATDWSRLKRFLNQFHPAILRLAEGGVVDSRWLTERDPHRRLNEAMCAEIEAVYPPLARAYDQISRQLYLAEKWALMAQHRAALNADPHHLITLTRRYDETFPLEEVRDFYPLDDAIRGFFADVLAACATESGERLQPRSLFTVTAETPLPVRAVSAFEATAGQSPSSSNPAQMTTRRQRLAGPGIIERSTHHATQDRSQPAKHADPETTRG